MSDESNAGDTAPAHRSGDTEHSRAPEGSDREAEGRPWAPGAPVGGPAYGPPSPGAPYGSPPPGAGPGGPYGVPPYGGPGNPYAAPVPGYPYGAPAGGAYVPYGGHPFASQPYGDQPYGGLPGGYGPYGAPPYGGHPYAGQLYGGQFPAPPARAPLNPEERRRRRRRGLVFAGVLVLALGAGIGIGAAVAPTNPSVGAQALVSQAVAAATHAGTFHYVELSTANGSPDNIIGDAAPDGGRQVITQRCTSGTDIFDLRLVKGVVYFRGNAAAVVDQLGVATTRAVGTTGRWVRVTKGEKPYKTFANGITTSSNLHQLPTTFVARSSAAMPGSSPPSTRVSGGIYAGKGKQPVGTASLIVTTATLLPRSLNGQAVNGTSGAHLSLSWTFSHWHQRVDVAAPGNPLAYSSLGAHPPTKGCA